MMIVWKIWRLLATRVRQRFLTLLSKWLFYTVILPRCRGSSNITVFAVVLIGLFILGNIAVSAVGIQSRTDLAQRLARLALINVIILFLGGRTNLFADKVLRCSFPNYYLLHRWIGRVTLLEVIVHGSLMCLEIRNIQPLEIAVLSTIPRRHKS